jgi:hypothetical protein
VLLGPDLGQESKELWRHRCRPHAHHADPTAKGASRAPEELDGLRPRPALADAGGDLLLHRVVKQRVRELEEPRDGEDEGRLQRPHVT